MLKLFPVLQAYLFNDYWEDIGTIKSFFEANLALAAHVSPLYVEIIQVVCFMNVL